eukprot:RCo006680
MTVPLDPKEQENVTTGNKTTNTSDQLSRNCTADLNFSDEDGALCTKRSKNRNCSEMESSGDRGGTGASLSKKKAAVGAADQDLKRRYLHSKRRARMELGKECRPKRKMECKRAEYRSSFTTSIKAQINRRQVKPEKLLRKAENRRREKT